MEDSIHNPSDEGIYIIDRRTTSIDDSVNALTNSMFDFVKKTRRQRINQRNRVERLSPLLDWKNLGLEYEKARMLALRRAYPDAFIGADEDNGEDVEWGFGEFPVSVQASPRLRISGLATPGDLGTLTEEMQRLETSDYRGHWSRTGEDEEDEYPFPLVMKVRSRASSVMSGASTPGGGAFKSLSEHDLQKADAALSQVNGVSAIA
jgi:glycogen(starch) synthase